MLLFCSAQPHRPYSAQHAGRIEPTSDARALIAEAVRMLAPLWQDGRRYMKVGVMLDDLRDAATQPRSLFPTRDPRQSAALMRAMDQVNGRYGRGALRPLATGIDRPWGTAGRAAHPRATPPISARSCRRGRCRQGCVLVGTADAIGQPFAGRPLEFYNRRRLHSALDYRTPEQAERQAARVA